MKSNHKKFRNWPPAGLAALLLSAVAVLPVPAGTSDSQTPTATQTEIANMTNADMRMEELPVTLVGASDTNAEFAVLRAKAEKGDAQSQFELGLAFYSGKLGLRTNYVEAVKWFRRAAEQNCADAQYNLGCCYAKGQGVARDSVEAVKWIRKAAEQGDATAQYNLALCYLDGNGVAEDKVEAVKWFRRAAEQNHAGAQLNLGIAYATGQGVAKDDMEAVKWYRNAAEQKLAQAQFNLGVCYDEGHGVRKDEIEAAKLYRKAAEQHYAAAQYNLGLSYRDSQGVAKDEVEAVKWFREAAEQNFAAAQSDLGRCYATGQGVAKDTVEAVKLFRKAAEKNYAPGQYNLGVCYRDSQGVGKDKVEAYKWMLLAGAQADAVAKNDMTRLEHELTQEQLAEGQERAGEFKPTVFSPNDVQQDDFNGNAPADLLIKAVTNDAKAQNELGEAFKAGKVGVAMDPVRAAKCFRLAADQNYAPAQCNLGVCYERGDGVTKYEVEAYKWDLLAAAQGDAKAKSNATQFELMMSPEQIADGKQRAKVWLERFKATSTSHASDDDSSRLQSR